MGHVYVIPTVHIDLSPCRNIHCVVSCPKYLCVLSVCSIDAFTALKSSTFRKSNRKSKLSIDEIRIFWFVIKFDLIYLESYVSFLFVILDIFSFHYLECTRKSSLYETLKQILIILIIQRVLCALESRLFFLFTCLSATNSWINFFSSVDVFILIKCCILFTWLLVVSDGPLLQFPKNPRTQAISVLVIHDTVPRTFRFSQT